MKYKGLLIGLAVLGGLGLLAYKKGFFSSSSSSSDSENSTTDSTSQSQTTTTPEKHTFASSEAEQKAIAERLQKEAVRKSIERRGTKNFAI